ncbi:hypothetical protein BpHYR1_043741 [Brachionus plicatilis]|uniref:Transmembrane protein n=1 Tax=Brachionus plicatilis TaxID=10195 RepID=A0A3M7SQ10_BRAPC|nr:hypothetical protein BpHYR1_043741 [Brachionus plicatilis]
MRFSSFDSILLVMQLGWGTAVALVFCSILVSLLSVFGGASLSAGSVSLLDDDIVVTVVVVLVIVCELSRKEGGIRHKVILCSKATWLGILVLSFVLFFAISIANLFQFSGSCYFYQR